MRVLLAPSAALQARVPRRFLCRPARQWVRHQVKTYLREPNKTMIMELIFLVVINAQIALKMARANRRLGQ